MMISLRHAGTPSSQQGFALLLALVIAGVALSIGLTLVSITTKQLDLNTTARQSEIAFQAASAGADCLSLVRYDVTNDPDDATYTCLGVDDFQLTEVSSGNPTRYAIDSSDNRLDWTLTNGDDVCVSLDLYVYEGDVTIDLSGRALQNTECAEGNTCAVGISRGYNRSCSDVSNGIGNPVEREITVEF